MRRVLLLTCAAFALGLTAGRVARLRNARATEEPQPARKHETTRAPRIPIAGDLRPAESARIEPRNAAPVESDRSAVLRVRFAELVAARDGEGLLALVRDALRAGPATWPLVLEIAVQLDEIEDLRSFGLTRYHLDRLVDTIYPAAAWAIEHANGLGEAALETAIGSVGGRADAGDEEALKLLLQFARTTPDDGLAGDAARSLGTAPAQWSGDLEALARARSLDDRALAALLDILVRHRASGVDELLADLAETYREREKTLQVLLGKAADHGSPAAMDLLARMAGDPRAAVSEEARYQLLRVRPPAPGVLVRSCRGQAAEAGLRRGDLIVEWNGAAFTDQLRFSVATLSRAPEERVPVKILRDGAPVELNLSENDLRTVSWNWTPARR